VIAETCYIKSAARDEGGGRNLFVEIVTYKRRQLRMTPATATFFPVSGFSCAQDRRAPKIQAARVPRDNMCVRPADLINNYQI
jgi:hypothetical protein